jgi:hypothetical protein
MGSRTAGSFRFDIENEVKIEASFRLCFEIFAITSRHCDVHIPKIEISQKKRSITIMPSLAQKNQQRKQNIKRHGKEGHLSGIPFTHTACPH